MTTSTDEQADRLIEAVEIVGARISISIDRLTEAVQHMRKVMQVATGVYPAGRPPIPHYEDDE